MKFANKKKVELIQHVVVAIEQRQVSWPRECAVTTDELNWRAAKYVISESAISPVSASRVPCGVVSGSISLNLAKLPVGH